jgi:hypothetical protein
MATVAHQSEGVGRPAEHEVVEAGPESIEPVFAPAINVLPQVRKTMEREPLDDLKASIGRVDEDAQLHLDLLNPLIVADLDAEHAAQYIADVNMFWGMNLSLEDMQLNPDTDRYIFLISGHRRLRAISELADEHEVERHRVRIATSPHRNISFQEALILQLKENTYHSPDPTELAEAIRLSYDFMKIDNPQLSQAQCAAELGFTPSRISRALAYSDLPDEIKGWVRKKDMSFTLAVILGHIQKEFRLRFDRMQREGMLAEDDDFADADEYASYEILTFANRIYAILQRNRRSTTQARDRAVGQLATLRQLRQFEQVAFEFDTPIAESARTRRGKAVGALAGFAFRGFAAAVQQDESVLERALAENPGVAEALAAALRRSSEQAGYGQQAFEL